MADAREPWVRLLYSRWLHGTRGLTDAERGVYITLCCLMYEADGPIVRKDDRLAILCGSGTARRFRKVLGALMAEGKIITLDDGRLWNERAEEEISGKASRIGKARTAANIRHGKSEQNQQNDDASAQAKQMREHPPSTAPSTLPSTLSVARDIRETEETEERIGGGGERASARDPVPDKDGRGREAGERTTPPSGPTTTRAQATGSDPLLARVREAAGVPPNGRCPEAWRDEGLAEWMATWRDDLKLSADEIASVAAGVVGGKGEPINTPKYLHQAMRRAAGRKLAAANAEPIRAGQPRASPPSQVDFVARVVAGIGRKEGEGDD